MEIERKFLVDHPPLELAVQATTLRQGYLAVDATRQSSVRIRQAGDRCTLTTKAQVPGLGMVARHEVEIPLSIRDFEALWPLTAGERVEKQRYLIPLGNLTAEVDCFDHGLQMVEVEFQTLEAAQVFEPPSWFDREVTNDPQFTNTWIARHGNPLMTQDR